MTLYRLKDSDDKAAFRGLLSHLAQSATRVLFIERDGLRCPREAVVAQVLAISHRTWLTSSWPGTELLGHQAHAFEFLAVDPILKIMSENFFSVSDLIYPTFFEDMHAFKGDELLFFSISHEKEALLTDHPDNIDFFSRAGHGWLEDSV